MIKIHPLYDTSWYLEELKKLFVHGNTSDNNFNIEFRNQIKELNNGLENLKIDNKFFTNYDNQLTVIENLVLADFATIKKIYKYILEYNLQDKLYTYNKDCGKNVPIKPWDTLIKQYKKFSTNNINNLIIEKFNITVCPYCNRDFINNRGYKNASAQLDHFFPKSQYPIFAICLYNLVPSCYTCNHIKKENIIEFSPHDNDINFDKEFKFTYTSESIDFLYNSDEIKIEFETNNLNIKHMKLDDAYNIHVDYVSELIKKAMIYNDEQVYEYLEQFSGIFSSKQEILRIVFSNYTEEMDLCKRPLAKLTKDILEELGVDLT